MVMEQPDNELEEAEVLVSELMSLGLCVLKAEVNGHEMNSDWLDAISVVARTD